MQSCRPPTPRPQPVQRRSRARTRPSAAASPMTVGPQGVDPRCSSNPAWSSLGDPPSPTSATCWCAGGDPRTPASAIRSPQAEGSCCPETFPPSIAALTSRSETHISSSTRPESMSPVRRQASRPCPPGSESDTRPPSTRRCRPRMPPFSSAWCLASATGSRPSSSKP